MHHRHRYRKKRLMLLFLLVVLLVGTLFSGTIVSAQDEPSEACAITSELVTGQGGFALTGLGGGFALTGLGDFALTGLGGDFALTGLGDLTEEELEALVDEITNNTVDPSWLADLVNGWGLTSEPGFNSTEAALLIVDDFSDPTINYEHGDLVAQVTQALLDAFGIAFNIRVELVDIGGSDIQYRVDAIAGAIESRIDFLRETEDIEHFVINMSFGLIPCESGDFDFDEFIEAVQQNNPPVAETCNAVEVVDYSPGIRSNGSLVPLARRDTDNVLGEPEDNDSPPINFVTLGLYGEYEYEYEEGLEFEIFEGGGYYEPGDASITLRLDGGVYDTPGYEIEIVETTYGNQTCDAYPDRAMVEASLDGEEWVFVGNACLDAEIDFDGAINVAKFIRISDMSDPGEYPGNGIIDGFDVDGIRCVEDEFDQFAFNNFNLLDYLEDMGMGLQDLYDNLDENALADLQELLSDYLEESAENPDFAVIPVASSGNYATEIIPPSPLSPASLPETIAVGAILGDDPQGPHWAGSQDSNMEVPGGWYEFDGGLVGVGTSYSGPAVSVIASIYLTFEDACNFDGELPPLTELGQGLDNDQFNTIIQDLLDCNPTPETDLCEMNPDSILVNGCFEEPVVPNNWDTFDEVPGWDIEWLDDEPCVVEIDPVLELQTEQTLGNVDVPQGNQYAELDSDCDGRGRDSSPERTTVEISQTLDTIPGHRYEVSFYFTARPGHGGQNLRVTIDGVEFFSEAPPVGWEERTFEFVATSTETVIAFADTGVADTFGVLLDCVNVVDLGPEPTGRLRVIKVRDTGIFNPDVSEISFEVCVFDSNNELVDCQDLNDGNNWRYTWNDVPVGDYTVVETTDNLPEGWSAVVDEVDATVYENTRTTVRVRNTYVEPERPRAEVCIALSELQMPEGTVVEDLLLFDLIRVSTSSGNAQLVEFNGSIFGWVGNSTGDNFSGPDAFAIQDQSFEHAYTFTFADDIVVTDFSVRVYDYGDYNPARASQWGLLLSSPDTGDTDGINFTTNTNGTLGLVGDSFQAIPGQPGNRRYVISGLNLQEVNLNFSQNGNSSYSPSRHNFTIDPANSADPYLGLDELCITYEELGELVVNKQVDTGVFNPDLPSFEMCVFHANDLNGDPIDCQDVNAGSSYSWDLPAGDYVVVETEPLLDGWTRVDAGGVVSVNWGETSEYTVRNQYVRPERPEAEVCIALSQFNAGTNIDGQLLDGLVAVSTSNGETLVTQQGNLVVDGWWGNNSNVATRNYTYSGFALMDVTRVHDYEFTFADDIIVTELSLRVFDWGDYNPARASEWGVELVSPDTR